MSTAKRRILKQPRRLELNIEMRDDQLRYRNMNLAAGVQLNFIADALVTAAVAVLCLQLVG